MLKLGSAMLPDAPLLPSSLLPREYRDYRDYRESFGSSGGSLLLHAIYRLAGLRSGPDLPASDPVTLSAQLCAAARALETDEGASALVVDPLARVLAGSQYTKAKSGRKLRPRIAIRTRYFDLFCTTRLPGASQLVILGAGMDTRAFRLDAVNNGHTVFEVDTSTVLDAKEFLLGTMRPAPRTRAPVHRVRTDLALDGVWAALIERAGFDRNKPTVWVIEGLLYYLEPFRVAGLLREVRAMSAPGSWVCFSAVTRIAPDAKGLGACFKSAIPDPMAAVTDAGFTFYSMDVLGGPNANFGRWKVATPTGGAKPTCGPGVKSATIYVKCFLERKKS